MLTSRGSLEISQEYNCRDFACGASWLFSSDFCVNSEEILFCSLPDNVSVYDSAKQIEQLLSMFLFVWIWWNNFTNNINIFMMA